MAWPESCGRLDPFDRGCPYNGLLGGTKIIVDLFTLGFIITTDSSNQPKPKHT